MKICPKCNLAKAKEDFYPYTKNGRQYRQTVCILCERARLRARSTTDRKRYRAADKPNLKERQENLRRIIREAKSVPCSDCGRTYPYYVMDFDHQGDKEFVIAKAVTKMISPERLLAEIAKCEVVCSNCHRERTFNANQRTEAGDQESRISESTEAVCAV